MKAIRLLKSFNFLYFGLLAIFIPFLPVYLADQGLRPAQIGFIIGTGGFVTLITQPLWGMISDKTRTIRKVLLLLIFFSSVIGYFLYDSSSYLQLILFAMLLYFFLMPIDPLTESLNFTMAEKSGISYGSIRTYGALGYAVISLITGYVMSYFGANSLAFLFAGIGLISFIVSWMMPDAPVSGKPVTLSSLKHFFSNKETLLFLLLVFICAVPARMNDTFLGVYIRELGGSAKLVGLTWFLAAGSEIVVFALSFWWLRKGKEIIIISFAAAFFFIRYFVSAWITDPQLLAYLQIMQLLTFPIFYSAAIQYLYRIVPVEWRATGQTVLALLFFGVSGIIASYIGGAIYGAYGGKTLYLFISSISFIGMVFALVLYRIYGTRLDTAEEAV
ncbi:MULTISPECIES: MFS transporter [Peribacillus]|jgi:PPP family 3-phenylpropionic acid transporter|uniref:MFS transporter n=1 Tax=Peribacillus TaxID=2675229 RepID=UPI000689CC48|nr:MFS transporter [Peribacillus frigoritolerans]MBD8134492.1 MFS transporter [Bacillus sp. CFBP 13597]MDP9739502.1 PPP family 3-phenylpropionic acid transporter [Bacillus sp. B2I3]MCK2017320.1 MFS transporter [Peribacillus frigoritolerans]MCY9006258.1 MFS transporter [Peribacillus frigoritolerans]MEB2492442.1 MFS transporter [Peribacillus frigoritolerans]